VLRPTGVLPLYAGTLFVGATLLFAVQPMVGKMILPFLGGSPAVWTTCMVFFQAVLLGGYAYAHASTAWLGVSRQAALHLAVLALPLAFLPLAVNPGRLAGSGTSPVLDILILLSVSVGLPFFVVSATAPLLQRWFTHTGHREAGDPYFLYAASNLGSVLALLSYPVLIEPWLPLRGRGWVSQTTWWSLAYLLLVALTVLCARTVWRSAPAGTAGGLTPAEEPSVTAPREDAPAHRQRLRWVVLALVPSSLLLGATTYITTDVAAVPLLWVLPLAIYILSFILAFGRWPARLHRAFVAATVPVVLLVIFLMVSPWKQRLWMMAVHLLLLLVVALACHGELALDRPSPRRLTEFYLLISVGGVLGGLFNALVAPAVFSSVVEYPLAMALGCMLVARRGAAGRGAGRRVLLDLALLVGVGALAFVLYSRTLTLGVSFTFITHALGLAWGWLDPIEEKVNTVLIYGPPLVACGFLRRRPLVLGLALASVLMVSRFVDARNSDEVLRARSFFGVLRVSRDHDEMGYIELRHGTTLHGRQSRDPMRREEPLSYYRREGPVGQLFAELDRRAGARRVAVIGLGTGTLAAYARSGDTMTFYEIDRLVRDIATGGAYFTYLGDARDRGATLRVELGDARIRLEAVRRGKSHERHDLIVVDAFSSDAIPVHLLTREALRLYLEMLAPDGLLALHLSNRHLALAPVVANLARDAALGGGLLQEDEPGETAGSERSTWMVLARTPAALGSLASEGPWTLASLEADPRVGVWTDDFHNLLSVFKWR
jgi:hypothetical protein